MWACDKGLARQNKDNVYRGPAVFTSQQLPGQIGATYEKPVAQWGDPNDAHHIYKQVVPRVGRLKRSLWDSSSDVSSDYGSDTPLVPSWKKCKWLGCILLLAICIILVVSLTIVLVSLYQGTNQGSDLALPSLQNVSDVYPALNLEAFSIARTPSTTESPEDPDLAMITEPPDGWSPDIGDEYGRNVRIANLPSPRSRSATTSSNGSIWVCDFEGDGSLDDSGYHPCGIQVKQDDSNAVSIGTSHTGPVDHTYGSFTEPVKVYTYQGGECVFPFSYEGTTYDHCTDVKHDRLWCAYNPVYVKKKWGDCIVRTKDGGKCLLPSLVTDMSGAEKTITDCTTLGSVDPWCPFKPTFDVGNPGNAPLWGYCAIPPYISPSAPAEPPCSVSTFDGNSDGALCSFPFVYEGVSYASCIQTTPWPRGKPWCSTQPLFGERWGHCHLEKLKVATVEGEQCVFPFRYFGRTYYGCTADYDDGGAGWCATTASLGIDSETWGYCDLEYSEACPNVEQEAYPDFTTNGNSGGAPCSFPFLYQGFRFNQCTQKNWNRRRYWCSTTPDYGRDRKWGQCNGLSWAIPSSPADDSMTPVTYGKYLRVDLGQQDTQVEVSVNIPVSRVEQPSCFTAYYYLSYPEDVIITLPIFEIVFIQTAGDVTQETRQLIADSTPTLRDRFVVNKWSPLQLAVTNFTQSVTITVTHSWHYSESWPPHLFLLLDDMEISPEQCILDDINNFQKVLGDKADPRSGNLMLVSEEQSYVVCGRELEPNTIALLCETLFPGNYSYGIAEEGTERVSDFPICSLDCSGAPTLSDCQIRLDSSCQQGETPGGITCREPISSELRLADGRIKGEGRVELYYNNRWGGVCPYTWDQHVDAICKHLGFDELGTQYYADGMASGAWRHPVGLSCQDENIPTCQLIIPSSEDEQITCAHDMWIKCEGYQATEYSSEFGPSCTFNDDLCGFVGEESWRWTRGPPPSHRDGPSDYPILGLDAYVYFEASWPSRPSDVSRITSPMFDAGDDLSMRFDYVAYDYDLGELKVIQKTGELETELVQITMDDMKAEWQTAVTRLEPAKDTLLMFEVTRGASYHGDFAIDNIRFAEEEDIITVCDITAAFWCGDNQCVQESVECDNNADCSNGWDEFDCTYNSATHFQCEDNTRIPLRDRCNGVQSCPGQDISDEIGCECGETQIQCDNGRCVEMNVPCDMENECSDVMGCSLTCYFTDGATCGYTFSGDWSLNEFYAGWFVLLDAEEEEAERPPPSLTSVYVTLSRPSCLTFLYYTVIGHVVVYEVRKIPNGEEISKPIWSNINMIQSGNWETAVVDLASDFDLHGGELAVRVAVMDNALFLTNITFIEEKCQVAFGIPDSDCELDGCFDLEAGWETPGDGSLVSDDVTRIHYLIRDDWSVPRDLCMTFNYWNNDTGTYLIAGPITALHSSPYYTNYVNDQTVVRTGVSENWESVSVTIPEGSLVIHMMAITLGYGRIWVRDFDFNEGACSPTGIGTSGSCPEFECRHWFQCISETDVCDGLHDCLDGSDETGCSSGNYCDFTVGESCDLIESKDGWLLWTGKTPTASTGPGFAPDQTSPVHFNPYQQIHRGENYYYAFSEASLREPGSSHEMSLDLNATDNRCLRFHYSMIGDDIGSLAVVVTSTNQIEEIIWKWNGGVAEKYRDDPFYQWSKAQVLIPAETESVVIKATRGSGDLGDIGIDKVTLQPSCTEIRCQTGMYACSDGKCIPREDVCNGVIDCAGGMDEEACPVCEEGEWMCSDGSCIIEAYVCDEYEDCSNDEDPDICSILGRSSPNVRPLSVQVNNDASEDKNRFPWLDPRWLQNSEETRNFNGPSSTQETLPHFSHESPFMIDEIRRPMSRAFARIDCGEGYFSCQNGGCVDDALACDYKDDCSDGSDENIENCETLETYNEAPRCEENLRCDNGDCVREEQLCDGIQDCMYGFDERSCTAEDCREDEMEHFCDGICWSVETVCDGRHNCADSSDELNCGVCDVGFSLECDNGQCVPQDRYCNGVVDCYMDEADEPPGCT